MTITRDSLRMYTTGIHQEAYCFLILEGDILTLSPRGLYMAEYLRCSQLDDFYNLQSMKLIAISEFVNNNYCTMMYLGYKKEYESNRCYVSHWYKMLVTLESSQEIMWFSNMFLSSSIRVNEPELRRLIQQHQLRQEGSIEL